MGQYTQPSVDLRRPGEYKTPQPGFRKGSSPPIMVERAYDMIQIASCFTRLILRDEGKNLLGEIARLGRWHSHHQK